MVPYMTHIKGVAQPPETCPVQAIMRTRDPPKSRRSRSSRGRPGRRDEGESNDGRKPGSIPCGKYDDHRGFFWNFHITLIDPDSLIHEKRSFSFKTHHISLGQAHACLRFSSCFPYVSRSPALVFLSLHSPRSLRMSGSKAARRSFLLKRVADPKIKTSELQRPGR